MARRDAGEAVGSEGHARALGAEISTPPILAGAAFAGRAGSPLDSLVRGSLASFNRRVLLGTTVALLLLAGISVLLAWRQYDAVKSSDLTNLEARAVSVGAIVDAAFGGDEGVLEAAADSPAVAGGNLVAMDAYFRRIAQGPGRAFSAGIGWVDTSGTLRASSTTLPAGAPINLAGRVYFKQVVATGAPYVSAGLLGRITREPLIAIAVPTHGVGGRLSGVLVGSILLGTVRESAEALALGFGGLEVVDRDGHLLLSRLALVQNRPLLARMERLGSGVLASTGGLGGRGSDAVAFAASKVPGWIVVLDAPRSALFASAQRALVLELASVGAALLVVFGLLGFVVRRARRDNERQAVRARVWSGLTRALASASTPQEVAEALRGSLVAAFVDAVVVVAFERIDEVFVGVDPSRAYAARVAGDSATLERIATAGREGAVSLLLDHESGFGSLLALPGRRLRALHALPVADRAGLALGTIAVLSSEPALEASEWALLQSFAYQAAAALKRARLYEHEHELAIVLQRSLLPDRLPSTESVELAGHYRAGGPGVEVGGDWYDAVRRPDGVIELCVGDVSGRGIGAATVMGRQRNAFQAYAHEYVSPADIIRRMLRHAHGDEMLTVACVSLDPYTGELVYSCAGHPPPLLLDAASGAVHRLDAAGAPPIGVAEPGDVREARLSLAGAATLALYTDGLIERRGESIDDGIDLLGRVLASSAQATPDAVLAQVGALLGEPDDDVALLLVRFDGVGAPFEVELPAEPSALPGIRRRLRSWLAHHELGDELAADLVLAVSEACNNAIEHAYGERGGSLAIRVALEGETVRVVVSDHGAWRPERPSDERGRGILLMRNLMDSAEIESDQSGTRVRLERRIEPRRAAVAPLAPSGSRS